MLSPQPPTLEKRSSRMGALFFVRTVCGVLVSRPLAGEALALYLEQEAQWKAKEVVPSAMPRDPQNKPNGRAAENSPTVKGAIGMSKSSRSTLGEVKG